MTMNNPPWMKMYFLLKIWIFQCHVSFLGGTSEHELSDHPKQPPDMIFARSTIWKSGELPCKYTLNSLHLKNVTESKSTGSSSNSPFSNTIRVWGMVTGCFPHDTPAIDLHDVHVVHVSKTSLPISKSKVLTKGIPKRFHHLIDEGLMASKNT